MRARLFRLLARRRVTLGFVSGVGVLYFARPTWRSLAVGALVGLAGEAFRIWAAGHLEKSREVTSSGPYRFTRHPLYLGSSVMAVGVAIGCRSAVVAVLVAVYMSVTLVAAIRAEEAFLRERFGDAYDAYAEARAPSVERRFSVDRAWRNREYRALTGLLLFLLLLVVRMLLGR
jgi:protein-S-isoprenylcysteine O-methyltransferase Ste14